VNKQNIFKKIQKLKLAKHPLQKVVPQEEVDAIECEINKSCFLNDGDALNLSIDSNPVAIKELLSNYDKKFNKVRLDSNMAQAQKDVLHTIINTFGLGELLSAYDKTGGNVDTVHNVRQGIYGTEKEKLAYERREKYDSKLIHQDKNYIDRNREISKIRKSTGIKDGYSDTILGLKDKVDLDHIISAKQTHDDPARVLAEIKTPDLANIPENLIQTSKTLNSRKQALPPDEYAKKLKLGSPERKDEIEKLNKITNRTNEQTKRLNTLNTLENVDPDKLLKKGKEAKDAQDNNINSEYYSSEKFLKNAGKSCALDSAKMGAQQAFGLLLMEFFKNSFSEIKSALNQGLEGRSLHADISIRLKRIGKNVLDKWKDVLEVGIIGLISGFLSSLVTLLINLVATTCKRLVRVIREGLFSLMKALKMLISPPNGMSSQEAIHEAMKLLIAGGLVASGIALEEVIEKLILTIPFLVPIAQALTAILVGSITIIVTALFIYLIDLIDLFGIIKIEKDKYIIEQLDNDIEDKLQRCENMALQLDDLYI